MHWGFYGKDVGVERRAGRYTESKAMEEMFLSQGSETAVLILHVNFQIQFYLFIYLFIAAMHILPQFTSTSPPPRPCYFSTELPQVALNFSRKPRNEIKNVCLDQISTPSESALP